MSIHLCSQERLQFPKKQWLNIQLKPPSSVQIPLNSSLLSFWSWFCAFFSGLSLWLSTSLFFRNTLQNLPATELWSVPLCWMVTVLYFVPGCHCFRKDPGSFGVFTTDGEAVCLSLMVILPGSWPLSCGSGSTGAGFPRLNSVLVFLEHLLLLRLCIARDWLSISSLCTWLVQTDVLCCPFFELFYAYGRGFTHWISKTNPFQFSEWLSQYLCRMSTVSFPEEPFQAFFLTCKDYQKGVKSALRELGLTLLSFVLL